MARVEILLSIKGRTERNFWFFFKGFFLKKHGWFIRCAFGVSVPRGIVDFSGVYRGAFTPKNTKFFLWQSVVFCPSGKVKCGCGGSRGWVCVRRD